MDGKRGSGKSLLAAHDDDSIYIYIYIYVYIYICVCVCVCVCMRVCVCVVCDIYKERVLNIGDRPYVYLSFNSLHTKSMPLGDCQFLPIQSLDQFIYICIYIYKRIMTEKLKLSC